MPWASRLGDPLNGYTLASERASDPSSDYDLASALDYTNKLSDALARDLTEIDTAILNRARSLNLDDALAHARALDLVSASASAHARDLASASGGVRSRELANALASTSKLASALVDALASASISTTIYSHLASSASQRSTFSLEHLAQYEGQLTPKQLSRLHTYLTSTFRLLECLEQAAVENRQAILDQLLVAPPRDVST